MRICALGSEGKINTIDNIRDGFKLNGHIIDYENPEVIFCNDPQVYKEGLALKEKTNAILIFNVLDIPIHLSEIDQILKEWIPLLHKADILTSISTYTSECVEALTNKKCYTIYNPIRDLIKKDIPRDNLFIAVGRVNDPNKRFNLMVPVVNFFSEIFRLPPKRLINIVGTDNPYYGNYLGVLSDEELSNIYNSTEVIFITSKIEGLCLPLIESMYCGCIPVVCRDMTTSKELAPAELICDNTSESIALKCVDILKNKEYYRDIINNFIDLNIHKFNKSNIANNIIKLANNYESKEQTNM